MIDDEMRDLYIWFASLYPSHHSHFFTACHTRLRYTVYTLQQKTLHPKKKSRYVNSLQAVIKNFLYTTKKKL